MNNKETYRNFFFLLITFLLTKDTHLCSATITDKSDTISRQDALLPKSIQDTSAQNESIQENTLICRTKSYSSLSVSTKHTEMAQEILKKINDDILNHILMFEKKITAPQENAVTPDESDRISPLTFDEEETTEPQENISISDECDSISPSTFDEEEMTGSQEDAGTAERVSPNIEITYLAENRSEKTTLIQYILTSQKAAPATATATNEVSTKYATSNMSHQASNTTFGCLSKFFCGF